MKQVIALLIATLIGVCLLPIQHATTPPFANPAFQSTWAEQSASAAQLDLWGSEPLAWRVEPYADAPDGRRVVQYFDRGRMELATAPGDSTQPTVTQGLLAQEMTTGEVQLGDRLTTPQAPPATSIDDGASDPRVPTFAALAAVVGQRVDSLVGTGAPSVKWIDSRGVPTAGPPPIAIRAAAFVVATGHNLPDVTVTFFSTQPFGSVDWVAAMGYPISEPYWTIIRRNDVALPSLIQVFQRRILVYTPSLSPDQRFTVTNIGSDYYRWRYGTDPALRWPDPLAGPQASGIAVPSGFKAGVYVQGLGTPIGLAIGPDGRLWILTEEGRILFVASERADGSVQNVTVFAQGLANPRGIAVVGNSVYVAVDNGVMRYDDYNLDGSPDHQQYLTQSVEPAAGSRGAPILDAQGQLFVAGTRLPDGRPHVVMMISPTGSLISTGQGFSSPGPGTVFQHQLYVVDRTGDGNATLLQYPLGPGTAGTGAAPQLDVTSGQIAAKFAEGASVTAVLWFNSALWPRVPPDTLLAATVSGNGGSVVRSVSRNNVSPPDLVDFATGFVRPTALAVGLDGSLFVADAGSGTVYKIIAPAANP